MAALFQKRPRASAAETKDASHDPAVGNGAQLQAVLDGLSEAVLIFDTELRVRLQNREAVRMFGDACGAGIASLLKGFIATERQERVVETDWPPRKALRTGVVVRASGVWERPEGEALYVEVLATPLRGEAGVEGVVVALRNIAPQLSLERELREFIAIISHQLRTPIATISWYLEILLSGKLGQLAQPQREIVQQARESVLLLADTIRLILDASRIELGALAVKPEPHDLRLLLEEEIDRMRHFAERKKQTVSVNFPRTLPTLPIDRDIFRFIVANLLSNAVKFTPEGGRITISVEEEPYRIRISVADTGIGIPAKDQPRMFTKFFRAENALMTSGGNGMGLYVVKLLLKLVGGDIWFLSEEGKGSTFSFAIPRKGFPSIKGRAILEAPVRPLY